MSIVSNTIVLSFLSSESWVSRTVTKEHLPFSEGHEKGVIQSSGHNRSGQNEMTTAEDGGHFSVTI